MLQAFIKKGKVVVEEVPSPMVSDGCLHIKVAASCISAGTEISGVKNSGIPLIKKALAQPEKVGKVFEIAKSEGIARAYSKVINKENAGSPTGYSISGVIIGIGKNVKGFAIGDCVAAAGAGRAHHAEIVVVPENLVVKIPYALDFRSASSVAIGSIAMQGVRRADLKIGEFGVVFGAGILGLISIQMLKASGVRVAAIDLDPRRLEIALELGAEIAINSSMENMDGIINWTNGFGSDAVIFTAATNESAPLSQAFKLCKRKGRVVLVGVSGMEINRDDIYPKEIDFLVSTSYGPGRYDSSYEEKGNDYPYAYVRWTEKRNMEEYLRLISQGLISLDKIIEAQYPIERVTDAYSALQTGNPKPLMVILNYGKTEIQSQEDISSQTKKIIANRIVHAKDKINIAIVGAGAFATSMHLPNLMKMKDKYRLKAIMNRTGSTALNVAKEYNADYSTTNYDEILSDNDIDMVLIATRHDSHADFTLKALEAGKSVFVEKPLATTYDDLHKISHFFISNNSQAIPLLFVGFNRRFSKYALEIKRHTSKRIGPLFIQYRMNAGFIPRDHWVHDHGGRIVGEACHIIDLMSYLVGSKAAKISCESLSPVNGQFQCDDNKSITIKYEDGSLAIIDYFSVGSKMLSKEFMEIHFDGKSIIMDEYKSLKGFGITIKDISSTTSDKGQLDELKVLHQSLISKDKSWPIELWDLVQTSNISLFCSQNTVSAAISKEFGQFFIEDDICSR